MPESLKDVYGGIGVVVAPLAEPRFVAGEMQQTAVLQPCGVSVVLLDQIVFRREQFDLDTVGVYPLVEYPLVARIVASPAGIVVRDVLEAGDRGGPLYRTSDREDSAVDLDRMAFVGAGFPEAGIQDRPERNGSRREQSGGLLETKDIAIEEEVSLEAEVSEGLELEEGPRVPPGVALFVRPDISVGRRIDGEKTVAMGEQKGIAEHVSFRAQGVDGERRMVKSP